MASPRPVSVVWPPPPSKSMKPRGVHARAGRIRFSVSVPVLSVQMTVVDPRVSTADSRFTRAPSRDSTRTPIASASVIVGSSPSGTLATMSPMAKATASDAPSPASMPRGRKSRPTPRATSALMMATRRTCRSSGLGSRPTRSDSAAMRPSSVVIPVASTSARASPDVHSVPLNTVSGAVRGTGADSPVRAEISTSISPETRRASADIRSPSPTRTRSPGTRSAASTVAATPSRTTRAVMGMKAASASTDRSACLSCRKAKTAFSSTTAMTAMAMAHWDVAIARAAATHSNRASGCTSCSRARRGQVAPARRRITLGPCAIRRRSASRWVSPVFATTHG